MKPFREMTEQEIAEMKRRCVEAVANYAREIGVCGLSLLGSHSVYSAIEDAIEAENRASVDSAGFHCRPRRPELAVIPGGKA